MRYLLVAFLLLVNGSAFAQLPCKDTDQLLQTRCQIENAFRSGNYSLADRIFDTSVYADANDSQVCQLHTYINCFRWPPNLDGMNVLFKHGFNANLRYGNYSWLAFWDMYEKQGGGENFKAGVLAVFLDHQLDLDQPESRGYNLRTVLASRCLALGSEGAGDMAAIRLLVARERANPDHIAQIVAAFDRTVSSHPSASSQHCLELRAEALAQH